MSREYWWWERVDDVEPSPCEVDGCQSPAFVASHHEDKHWHTSNDYCLAHAAELGYSPDEPTRPADFL